MKRISNSFWILICVLMSVSSCHKNNNPMAPTIPSITTQPVSQTIAIGTSATFKVVASGSSPLSYQWSLDGTPIDGATSASYTTPLTPRAGTFTYTAIVSNSLGADSSNSATLKVVASGAVKVYSGKYWDWYADASGWAANMSAVTPDFIIMDSAVDQIDKDWGTSPPTQKLYVYVPATGSGGAYSTGDIGEIDVARGASPSPGIGLDPGLFSGKSYGAVGGTAIVFGVHETVNQLTADVSIAGWPVDWWADDKSPFPGMTEVHILNEMGYKLIAQYDDQNLSGDSLYIMMKSIQTHYGWGIFTGMFTALRSIRNSRHISDWSGVDGGAANPSPQLTAYVTAYMVKASGQPLSTFTSLVQGILPGYNQAMTQAALNSL